LFEKEDLIKIANHRMPFGKYAGCRLIDLPEPYLLWFKAEEFPTGKLGELMQVCLEIKINGLESLIDPLRSN